MAGQRLPLALIEAKGAKHLTKAEKAEREAREVKPCTDDIAPPGYLTKKQKDEFKRIAAQLEKLKIMGETDVDTLARYILARDTYSRLTKQIQRKEIYEDPFILDKYMKNQDRAFKQCHTAAKSLGLTIADRCRLVVPEIKVEAKKENKFARFEKRAVGSE